MDRCHDTSVCTCVLSSSTNPNPHLQKSQSQHQAILRRLPRQFEIALPSAQDRARILEILLRQENVDRKNVKLDRLAQMTVRAWGLVLFVLVVFRAGLDPARPPPPNEPTHRTHANTQPNYTNQEGYSGSDLKEMCRAAVMAPVRELVPYREDGSLTSLDLEALDVGRCRKVKMRDFEAAMKRVCTYVSSCIDSMPPPHPRPRFSRLR